MTVFSSKKRNEIYANLTDKPLDLLVIGGGITGSGISLDARMRGMNVGLVEMQDFAAGTSSRSTKLVHGGLRYLKQFEVKMVAEVGKEREIVYENGPHVTTPEWMLLPFHKGGTMGPFMTNIGLRVYDYLAGVKKAERRTMLKRDEVLEREPLVKSENLLGGGRYVEYKTDDARLTLEVLKKAVEKGVHAINYTKVTEFIYDAGGKVTGVVAENLTTGEKHRIFAKKIVNAGGPWVDTLREKDGSKKGKTLHLTKGVHLVFDGERFPLRQAVYFDTPDGRMVFAIPREGKTYVGTTDTTYKGDIKHPVMTVEDRDYIIDSVNYMFPTVEITKDDVESSWAGLRPLIQEENKKPGEISRKDEIFVSDSGLISMAGGKLTGYRKMAIEAVNLVADQFKKEEGILYSQADTKHLPISGGEVGGSKGFERFKERKVDEGKAIGLTAEDALKMVSRYGANVDKVFERFETLKDEAKAANIDPLVFAQLRYAIEEELAFKPVDFFVRRTGALLFNINFVHTNKDAVIDYMAETLGYSAEQKSEYTRELDVLAKEAVVPVKEDDLQTV
ncbi:glycerol-3-phosphate dehydrogenase [Terribacillus saccharophilus]|uniref:Aerobic glycerol-3-phosphate dehydrogenase n=1 Tax=Terribacillus saccharophilus TaxID=361277 RepID=A0A268HGU7_9BACI|nr:FAD-dependent oxidoreductase [Terribacillus saccharophilus]PAE09094.1 glycerol-3-phosphate dehydrogenase [Terribacillus saccharophilus]